MISLITMTWQMVFEYDTVMFRFPSKSHVKEANFTWETLHPWQPAFGLLCNWPSSGQYISDQHCLKCTGWKVSTWLPLRSPLITLSILPSIFSKLIGRSLVASVTATNNRLLCLPTYVNISLQTLLHSSKSESLPKN